MAQRKIRICDECGVGREVEQFLIEGGGRLAKIDLCPEHAEPLLALLDAHSGVPATTIRREAQAPRRTPYWREMLTTPEELEALIQLEARKGEGVTIGIREARGAKER